MGIVVFAKQAVDTFYTSWFADTCHGHLSKALFLDMSGLGVCFQKTQANGGGLQVSKFCSHLSGLQWPHSPCSAGF